jgi:hypothetical protein
MKTLNAKRVAAIAAGAALLGMGLAFAGSVTFQNVMVVSNSGQPVVQVVVGTSAKASDGIAAANIAAAIGNLAYTSVPVQATVNTTEAKSVLKVSVTSASGTSGISNPQVWLNESSSAAPTGTYAFTSLIGSVLNRAVLLGSPANTKSLQGSTTQYAYPESTSLTASPMASPYSTGNFIPFQTVSSSTNGGGVSFTGGFRSGIYDNILQVTNANLAALLSNAGSYGENEYLWLTGFPVFDQGTSSSPVNQFAIASAGGAYQVTFNKPIPILTGSNSVNQPSITLLGKTWTILNYTAPGAGVNQLSGSGAVTSTTDAFGGSITLAASLVPLTTVYVGHNLTSGPFTVQLTDLGQPNANGIVPASLAVYYNGQLTNTSASFPAGVGTGSGTVKFNVTGNLLFVKVNQTFAGLYQYQKWAKIQLFSNVQPFTNGNSWNSTTNPGWEVLLGWTNSTSGTKINALQTIIAYNTTPLADLMAGQSFSFITTPAAYKMTLAGDTLGNNFDALTSTVSSSSSVNYQNNPTNTGAGVGNINNITEPVQYLTVTSQIPNAFSYAGQVASSVSYDLVPYTLTEAGNSITKDGATGSPAYLFANTIPEFNGLINSNNQLTITVYGYPSNTATSQVSNSFTMTTLGSTAGAVGSNSPVTTLYNVTKITVSEDIPGLSVYVGNNINTGAGANTLASLTAQAPVILYTPASSEPYTYAMTSAAQAATIVYNQQNGQPTSSFQLASVYTGAATPPPYAMFTYNVVENPVPGQTSPQDAMSFALKNSTSGAVAASGAMFQMNYSAVAGTHNNVTYFGSNTPSTAPIDVRASFRTEKGSKVQTISPASIVLDLAKAVDELAIDVGPTSSSVGSTAYKLYGPYGLGQLTNLANVSIGKVTANATLGSGSTYSITGISNITATPSVSKATTPVLLTSLATTPLVVNDTMASSSTGSLILVGSGYVNTLSAQLQKSYNISMTTSTQIDQAYGNRILVAGYYASQTTAAANAFIAQLYANAATSS